MSDSQRLHRQQPERTEPIRSFSTLLRDTKAAPEGGNAGERAKDEGGGERVKRGLGSAVAWGVERGYSVVEDQIREGCGLAALRTAGRGDENASNQTQVQAAVERLLGCYSDIGRLSLELVDTLARGSLGDVLKSAASAEHKDAPAPSSKVNFSINVSARCPTQVSVSLNAEAGFGPFLVLPLHAPDRDIAPLGDISITPDLGAGRVTLGVRVPENQPAGLYTGAIVDATNHSACGTLSVRVGE